MDDEYLNKLGDECNLLYKKLTEKQYDYAMYWIANEAMPGLMEARKTGKKCGQGKSVPGSDCQNLHWSNMSGVDEITYNESRGFNGDSRNLIRIMINHDIKYFRIVVKSYMTTIIDRDVYEKQIIALQEKYCPGYKIDCYY